MLGPRRIFTTGDHVFYGKFDTKPNGVPAVQQHTTIETVLNMTPENKEHFLSEKEAIFLLLTGIGDEIYSTVDACKTANEIWIAIERLQQVESLNVQDVKTNMFWEFGKFTSRDGESMESYYSRIRAERIAKSANPLALLAAAQPYSDNYYQAPKPQRSNETRDPLNKLQRDKDMQKNLALLAKYFKKLYKPTNNNLRTSSNSRNKTEDTAPRKPKRVKDYSYHKEKMMMCKQAEQGVPLQAEQADWLADTDEEIDEQELEAHYSFMAKIQEVLPGESISTEASIGTGTKQ
ncbi:hypothetical protein Tco_0535950 [Tanacetum coccineum]